VIARRADRFACARAQSGGFLQLYAYPRDGHEQVGPPVPPRIITGEKKDADPAPPRSVSETSSPSARKTRPQRYTSFPSSPATRASPARTRQRASSTRTTAACTGSRRATRSAWTLAMGFWTCWRMGGWASCGSGRWRRRGSRGGGRRPGCSGETCHCASITGVYINWSWRPVAPDSLGSILLTGHRFLRYRVVVHRHG
jgi:hypothetical protein